MNKNIKKTVYDILKEDEYARKDDNYLIMRVVQELEPELAGTTFVNVMQNITYKSISCESITRNRREFFREYPELKDKKATASRQKEESLYKFEFGNHIPRID